MGGYGGRGIWAAAIISEVSVEGLVTIQRDQLGTSDCDQNDGRDASHRNASQRIMPAQSLSS